MLTVPEIASVHQLEEDSDGLLGTDGMDAGEGPDYIRVLLQLEAEANLPPPFLHVTLLHYRIREPLGHNLPGIRRFYKNEKSNRPYP